VTVSIAGIYWNDRTEAVLQAPSVTPLAFHRRMPDYAPTPLRSVPSLATALGVGTVLVKDESRRLGLPAFKMLGASWAIYQALRRALPDLADDWQDIGELRERVAPLAPLTLVAATDRNHGRAVARMARLLGFRAEIFVPAGTAGARIAAIEDEGATVVVVPGTYESAVERSTAGAGPRRWVISDTSWPGYEDVPRDVIDGYGTIFAEVSEQRSNQKNPPVAAPVAAIVVQMGVGALAAAVIDAARRMTPRPRVIGVEPETAACILASLRAGEPVSVPDANRSIMAGLNCDSPSPVAWPRLRAGLDVDVAIPDETAKAAMRLLADAGIAAGETGAAGLGGLLALRNDDRAWARLGLGPASAVLIIVTEGPTDPAAWTAITGHAVPTSSQGDVVSASGTEAGSRHGFRA
jgi:diaminopropionate ammonia-lyase